MKRDRQSINGHGHRIIRARGTGWALVFVCSIVLFLSACGKSNPNAGQTIQGSFGSVDSANAAREAEEEQEEEESEEDAMFQDIYVITDVIDDEERFVLKSLTTNRQFRFAYGLTTQFLDKWGNITSQTDFARGRVVTIGKPLGDAISSMTLYKEAWIVEDLTNFSYDESKELFAIGNSKYHLRPTASIFSGDLSVTIGDVTQDDRLCVVGIDREVVSVTVTTGHGYIALQNTSFFNGSLITIGTRIHAMLNGDATMSVPAGKYTVTVAKDGYGGSTEVEVIKNETVTINLDTLKGEGPKMCELTFHVPIEDAHVYVDNHEVEKDAVIKVTYGEHKLKIEAKGYDTWEKTLVVNSPSAEITLDPSEDVKTDDDASASVSSATAASSAETPASSTAEAASSTETTAEEASASTEAAASSTAEDSDSTAASSTSESASSSAEETSSSSNARAQAELDYLTTLSHMIDILTGGSSQ